MMTTTICIFILNLTCFLFYGERGITNPEQHCNQVVRSHRTFVYFIAALPRYVNCYGVLDVPGKGMGQHTFLCNFLGKVYQNTK